MNENTNEIRSAPCPTCILCGSEGEIMYEGLRDRLFGASGSWNCKKCPDAQCGLLWLDPMPLPEDIGKAYAQYYTHAPLPTDRTSLFKRFVQLTERRWLSTKYGYPEDPADLSSSLLKKSHYLFPFYSPPAIAGVRFLPFVRNGRLLDVGCGSGGWLAIMKNLGWAVEGVDFDPKAVKAAAEINIKVQIGSVEDQKYPPASFDAITLSHVIEHVPDPIGTIMECARLLKPGGRLMLYTPNASSRCHYYFKRDWRGLEPPRHLHIFSFTSMQKLFDRAGFKQMSIRPHIGTSVTYESWLLRRSGGRTIDLNRQAFSTRLFLRLFAGLGHLLVGFMPSVGEVLAVVAVKK